MQLHHKIQWSTTQDNIIIMCLQQKINYTIYKSSQFKKLIDMWHKEVEFRNCPVVSLNTKNFYHTLFF